MKLGHAQPSTVTVEKMQKSSDRDAVDVSDKASSVKAASVTRGRLRSTELCRSKDVLFWNYPESRMCSVDSASRCTTSFAGKFDDVLALHLGLLIGYWLVKKCIRLITARLISLRHSLLIHFFDPLVM